VFTLLSIVPRIGALPALHQKPAYILQLVIVMGGLSSILCK
jgi:hypothetical protein